MTADRDRDGSASPIGAKTICDPQEQQKRESLTPHE